MRLRKAHRSDLFRIRRCVELFDRPQQLTARDLADQLQAVAQLCGAESRQVGVPYGTDAPAIAAAGVPTVVFGPGSVDQAHTTDEWIAVDQVQAAAEIYYEVACRVACL